MLTISKLRKLGRTKPHLRIIIYSALYAERAMRTDRAIKAALERTPAPFNLIAAGVIAKSQERKLRNTRAKISRLQMKIFLEQRTKHHV